MNAEELKMECSPVVLRAEIERLQAEYEGGRRCELHSSKLHDNCLNCGAPQCCWICCREATLEQRIHICQQVADELAEALKVAKRATRSDCDARDMADAALAAYDAMVKGSNDGK